MRPQPLPNRRPPLHMRVGQMSRSPIATSAKRAFWTGLQANNCQLCRVRRSNPPVRSRLSASKCANTRARAEWRVANLEVAVPRRCAVALFIVPFSTENPRKTALSELGGFSPPGEIWDFRFFLTNAGVRRAHRRDLAPPGPLRMAALRQYRPFSLRIAEPESRHSCRPRHCACSASARRTF
jgi:hypothetical protein